MPESYLSHYQSGPAFLAGMQIGSRLLAEEQADARQKEREDAAQKALDERYRLQLQNAVAEKALDAKNEANKIKTQNTLQWRKDYWNKNVSAYMQNLTLQRQEAMKYLDPKVQWQFTPETVKAAQDHIAAIDQKSTELAQATPQDWSEFQDPKPHLTPIDSFTPEESEQAKKIRESNIALRNAQIAHAQASTSQANASTALTNARRTALLAGKSPEAKMANDVLKRRQQFLAATGAVFASGTKMDPNTGRILPPAADEITGQAGEYGKNVTSAFTNWSKNRAFIEDLMNPAIAGDDVAALVSRTAPKFNGLMTFDDFSQWMHNLHALSSSKEGASIFPAYKKLNAYVYGAANAGMSESDATPDDESTETTPDDESTEGSTDSGSGTSTDGNLNSEGVSN